MAELMLDESSRARGPVGRQLERICKVFAVISGLVLTAMGLMSIASILGRSLLSSPIVGDYELVQSLCAVTVSMALPYTQWVRANVIVDFFTAKARPKTNAALDAVASLLLAFFSGIFAWRMTKAMWELKQALDVSMLLNIPTWLTYVPMVASFVLLCAVSLYTADENIRKLRS